MNTKFLGLVGGAAVVGLSVALPAEAFTRNITGGTCDFSDFSTGGLLQLFSCENTTGVDVTDIHLEIEMVDEDNQVIAELTKNIDRIFAPVPTGSSYIFNTEVLGLFVYTNGEIANAGGLATSDNLRLSGYWTNSEYPESPGVPPCCPEQDDRSFILGNRLFAYFWLFGNEYADVAIRLPREHVAIT